MCTSLLGSHGVTSMLGGSPSVEIGGEVLSKGLGVGAAYIVSLCIVMHGKSISLTSLLISQGGNGFSDGLLVTMEIGGSFCPKTGGLFSVGTSVGLFGHLLTPSSLLNSQGTTTLVGDSTSVTTGGEVAFTGLGVGFVVGFDAGFRVGFCVGLFVGFGVGSFIGFGVGAAYIVSLCIVMHGKSISLTSLLISQGGNGFSDGLLVTMEIGGSFWSKTGGLRSVGTSVGLEIRPFVGPCVGLFGQLFTLSSLLNSQGTSTLVGDSTSVTTGGGVISTGLGVGVSVVREVGSFVGFGAGSFVGL